MSGLIIVGLFYNVSHNGREVHLFAYANVHEAGCDCCFNPAGVVTAVFISSLRFAIDRLDRITSATAMCDPTHSVSNRFGPNRCDRENAITGKRTFAHLSHQKSLLAAESHREKTALIHWQNTEQVN